MYVYKIWIVFTVKISSTIFNIYIYMNTDNYIISKTITVFNKLYYQCPALHHNIIISNIKYTVINRMQHNF